MKSLQRILASSAPAAVLLIRLVVGAVFLSEGIQKFLFPNDLGAGRFIKIGIPAPQIMAPFVGVIEIVCGGLIITLCFCCWSDLGHGPSMPAWPRKRSRNSEVTV